VFVKKTIKYVRVISLFGSNATFYSDLKDVLLGRTEGSEDL
jgi:hypothetical protein